MGLPIDTGRRSDSLRLRVLPLSIPAPAKPTTSLTTPKVPARRPAYEGHKKAAEKVLQLLYDESALKKKELLKKCGMRKKRVTDAIGHLYRLRVIQRSGKGKRGSAYIYTFR